MKLISITVCILGNSSKVRSHLRGTQRQVLENICSEDDLRSRIFGIFVVKFLACLPPLGFSNPPPKCCIFLTDFFPKKVN